MRFLKTIDILLFLLSKFTKPFNSTPHPLIQRDAMHHLEYVFDATAAIRTTERTTHCI